jgi:hypothetical protein
MLGETLPPLPTIILLIGLTTSVLLASLAYFAQTTQQRAVQLSDANQALNHEIAEREHAESTLSRRLEQLEVLRIMSAELTRELDLPILLDLGIGKTNRFSAPRRCGSAHDAGGRIACRSPEKRRWRKALGAFYRVFGPMELSAAVGYTTHLGDGENNILDQTRECLFDWPMETRCRVNRHNVLIRRLRTPCLRPL